MRAVEAEGLEVCFHDHDEIVVEVEMFRAAYALEKMTALMSVAPAWAAGLPLAAEGWKGKRYRK
jgi:DNA polymerase